jgi:ribosomal-protein-alanine N-acetyltransferase
MAIERVAFQMAWSSTVMRDSLMAAHCRGWGIFADHQLVGYGILSVVLDEAEILSMGIDPLYHRRGYGDKLLAFLIQEARKIKVETMLLEVQDGNTAALKLYEKHLFKLTGVRKNYYPTPDPQVWRDALLLRLDGIHQTAHMNHLTPSESNSATSPHTVTKTQA